MKNRRLTGSPAAASYGPAHIRNPPGTGMLEIVQRYDVADAMAGFRLRATGVPKQVTFRGT
jgi:hypothetical protein